MLKMRSDSHHMRHQKHVFTGSQDLINFRVSIRYRRDTTAQVAASKSVNFSSARTIILAALGATAGSGLPLPLPPALQQLTCIFCPQVELVYYIFGRHRFPSATTANLERFVRRFNELQNWVVTELCLCAELQKRALLLKKFIKIAMV